MAAKSHPAKVASSVVLVLWLAGAGQPLLARTERKWTAAHEGRTFTCARCEGDGWQCFLTLGGTIHGYVNSGPCWDET